MLLSRKFISFAGVRPVSVCQFTTSIPPVAEVKSDEYRDPEYSSANPTSKIPGPTPFQLLKRFLPGGKYTNKTLSDIQKDLFAEYGPIAKFPSMFGRKPFVFIFDPNDIEKLYRTEGHWPTRPTLDSFVYYRRNYRQDLFGGMGGLLTERGLAWQTMRTKVNPVMMQPRNTKKYVPIIDNVTMEFMNNLRNNIDRGVPPIDLYRELNKWALESIGFVALDAKLGVITDPINGNKLIDLVQKFFLLSFELDMKPSLWRYIKTPKFRQLMSVTDQISDLIDHHIKTAITVLEEKPKTNAKSEHELSVLEKLLKVDKHTAVVMAFDMILAGIDTTGTAATLLLYNLSRCPEKQSKLRDELRVVMPTKESPITDEVLQKLPYLRACMKESHRLTPVVAGNVRNAGADIVIKGYQIPKLTDVIGGAIVCHHSEKEYPRSREFIPERWLANAEQNGCPSAKNAHPFSFLPFGFGSRMCVGKRFADMEIAVLTSRVIRNYELEWTLPELKFMSRIINTPVGDITFKYTDVND